MGEKPFIYVENTYRLGYESMQMLEKKGKTKRYEEYLSEAGKTG